MQFTYTGSDKERLDTFLHRKYPDLSRSKIQKWILAAAATVNGKPASVHHWLKNGDVIAIGEFTAVTRTHVSTAATDPEILYQDDEFAVILKPAGLLTHPTERDEDDTLVAWLTRTFPGIAAIGDDPKRPGIVHRLDRDVAGLILIALTPESFAYYKQLFARHEIEKQYRCLVHGVITHDEGQIDLPIDRDKEKGRMVVQSGKASGKEALTLYHVVQRFVGYTLLDVRIITGRTHQIRAHLYSIGHSIVGDPLYQTKDVRRTKHKRIELEQPFLFAYHLVFVDRNGKKHDFTLELPERLRRILKDLQPL